LLRSGAWGTLTAFVANSTSVAPATVEALFDCRAEPASPALARSWIPGLYVLGALVWAYFLGWGRVPLNFHDWADINVPRLTFLGNAIAMGEWPWHMADTHSLHGVTDRFLTLPDVITTPQTLLLPWLGVARFMFFDILLHYTAGVAGLIALRRRLEWSLFTYAVIFLLFLFNGHVLSHYSVGHFTWASYFLFPWFVLCCLQLLDGEHGWPWVARTSFLLFYMVLAGGQHHFTWALIFLGCLLPFCLDRALWIVAAGAAAGLLSAVRLLPPVLSLDAFANAGWISDVIGYPSLLHLVRAMAELRRENAAAVVTSMPGNFLFFETNYFEFAYYVGVVGFAVIAYFGLYAWFRERAPRYPQLIVPTLVMVVLSLGSMYRLVRMTGIPLLMSERLVSRMLSLPMSVIMIMAGVYLQRALNQAGLSLWNRVAALAVLALLAIDLSGEVRLMRVSETAKTTKAFALDASVGAIARRDDPVYTRTVAAGAGLSMLTGAGLIVLAVKRPRVSGEGPSVTV
jgi:hypothetical protein